MAELSVRGFNCRTCGAPVTPRGLSWSKTIVCPSCGTVQDPSDPTVRILQDQHDLETIKPIVPLGTRGTIDGVPYEVIGFQRRTITVDNVDYSWHEYLLFNPYHGFRYLSEYEGHWNLIQTLHALPVGGDGTGTDVDLEGERFRHFQTAAATTSYVLGEFPWRVRVGDVVTTTDYVAPPRLLSSESTAEETTWSLGRYVTGGEIWKWFQLPGKPPAAEGIFANQPSPYAGRVGRMWKTFLLLAGLLLLVFIGREVTAARTRAFAQSFTFTPGAGEPSFVTAPFHLDGPPSTVAVEIQTDLANNWLYYNLALIDIDSGTAFDFGDEVSYYFGHDSDGNWTEGSRHGEVEVPAVPAGQYYLRVEPEGDANARVPVHYTLTVVRGVVTWWPYVVALVLLVVPPIVSGVRSLGFEGRRWAESDHASSSSDDEEDDSSDDD